MAYIGNGPGVASQRVLTTLTATDGQTTFVPSAGYTLGYVDVYFNGVKLIDGSDYTASNGVNIVLTEAATAGDIVEVVTYFPRGLSDGYTKAEADARYMDINAVTLPDQTGHAGQFLQSDGTNADWATVDLTQFDAPVQFKNYTTTQRNALTGLATGDTIFNSTTGSIEFYDGANWVATNLIPTVNSVSGTIYAGVASTLTLSTINATESITVRFSEGGVIVADVGDVTVTSGSASVPVPAAVYGQTAGDTIAVSILNQDGTPSSNAVNKTVVGVPSGGTVTTSGGYRYHTFTSSGTFTNTVANLPLNYLVVAGGAGGGGEHGGGGGAGGYIASSTTASDQGYAVVIGSGGAGSTSPRPGVYGGDGNNSSAFGSTAIGGGSGGYRYANGRSGGSGGGAGGDSDLSSGGAGTSGQGFAGGGSTGVSDPYQGGGGGGASEVGVTAIAGQSVATHGGDGKQWLNGTTYAGGGGGGVAYQGTTLYGSGGAGGGGRGATATAPAVSGTTNTGGGGGGANRYATGGNHQGSSIGNAGSGGSGIVIIRYQLP